LVQYSTCLGCLCSAEQYHFSAESVCVSSNLVLISTG
jgi:hypothetical protein